MANRIKSVALSKRRLDPIEAEIWITVDPEEVTTSTEVRGRLVGPRSPYGNTVEVAYPLRELANGSGSIGIRGITLQAVIPEPNLWHPATPFVYDGLVELWQDGKCVDRAEIRQGLRSLRLGARGPRLNDKPIMLLGTARADTLKEDAAKLRRSQCNAILAPISSESPSLWRTAEELGFFAIGEVKSSSAAKHAAVLATGGQGRKIPYASMLGWLLTEAALRDELIGTADIELLSSNGGIVGVEIRSGLPPSVPGGVSFVACNEDVYSSLAGFPLPVLLLSERDLPSATTQQARPELPAVIGTIYEVGSR
jgi:hypothetical protein